MGLEAGTHVSDLVITNPLAGDLLSEADDHLRLLKTVLRNSFPTDLRGVSGPRLGQKLCYDGTSFRNFTLGQKTHLRWTAGQAYADGVALAPTIASEIQDDFNIYSSGTNVVLTATSPTSFGVFVQISMTVGTNPTPAAKRVRFVLVNTTATIRNPGYGPITYGHDIHLPSDMGSFTGAIQLSCILLPQLVNTANPPQTGDNLRVEITVSGGTAGIINQGDVIFFAN